MTLRVSVPVLSEKMYPTCGHAVCVCVCAYNQCIQGKARGSEHTDYERHNKPGVYDQV